MIEYKKIDYKEYNYLKDKSGYYLIKYPDCSYYNLVYSKNCKFHNEYGWAAQSIVGKEYWLNNIYYGSDKNYTDKEWIRFCKLKVFQ